MIWKVMQFEWRMLRADASTLLITSLFVLLTGAALWQGMSGLKARQMAAREFTEAQGGVIARALRAVEEDEAREKAEGEALFTAAIGPRSPGAVLSRLSEFQVSLPPLSLALLGGDQGELYPTTYKYRLSDGDYAPSPAGATIAEVERVARFETQSSITDVVNRIVDGVRNRYPIIEGKEETMERYRRAVYTDLIEVPTESDLLNSFLRRRPEIPRKITPYQLRQIERLARDEFIEQKLAPQLALRHKRQKRQQWVITLAGLFSPALALQKAQSEVAGASRIRHSCFLDQLDRHIRAVRDLLTPRIFLNQIVRASDFERIKAFEFVEETNASLAKRLMPQFAILTLLPLLMSFFAVLSLRRFSAIA